jgi:MYXO-CTERM domain-containing protein
MPNAGAGTPDAASEIDASPGEIDANPGEIDASPGEIDASPGEIDASPGEIDASSSPADAGAGTDAGIGEVEGGCGCRGTRPGSAPGLLMLVLAVMAALRRRALAKGQAPRHR